MALRAAGAAGAAAGARHAESGGHLAALADDAAFAELSGKYFDGLKPIASSSDSYDRDKALDLWQTSERLMDGGDPDRFPVGGEGGR